MPKDRKPAMPMHGEPAKPYQIFRTGLNGELVQKLAEADTREGLWKIHRQRTDYKYAILHKRRQIWPANE